MGDPILAMGHHYVVLYETRFEYPRYRALQALTVG